LATSTESELVHAVDMGEGVTASVSGRVLTVKGPLGTVNKRFDRVHVNMEVKDGKVFALREYTDSHYLSTL